MRKLDQFLRRFVRARDGATTVEYALIAVPFAALLFAMIELGLVFLVQTTLDNATEAAARQIRTGELQAAKGDAASFKAAICNEVSWFGSSCNAKLKVDVQVFSSFQNQTPTSLIKNGSFDDGSVKFTPGCGGSIVLVRTFYQWPTITPLLSTALINLADNKRLIGSTVTFRNEPFTQC